MQCLTNRANNSTQSRSLGWFILNPWLDDVEIMNIWKSDGGTVGWRIKWEKIIVVIDATCSYKKKACWFFVSWCCLLGCKFCFSFFIRWWMNCTCVFTIISYCKCSAVMLYVLVKSGAPNNVFFCKTSVRKSKHCLEVSRGWKDEFLNIHSICLRIWRVLPLLLLT